MPNSDDIPVQRRGFQLEELDGETLLYRHSLKKLIYLNGSAAAVWKLCDGRRTVAELVALLIEAYPDAGDGIRADIDETLERLVREGALRIGGEPEAGPTV